MSNESFYSRHPKTTVGGAIGLVVLLIAGYLFWDYASRFEATDDAFIAARQYAIAPKISGYVVNVPVTDNQHVKTGDLIAEIDPRDYKVALEQAEAEIGTAQANITNATAQLGVQKAQINAGESKVVQTKASQAFAEQQAARYADLARKGAGSVQNEQQYVSQLNEQNAALAGAEASLEVAKQQIFTIEAQIKSAQAQLAQATAQRDQAALNLSHTKVIAAEPGRIVQLSGAKGQFAQAGTALSMFVPDELWVVANYKETKLDHMRPGQPVSLYIDAYPSREIQGSVASVQPGSGTAFSLLPAQNATGNYVKIVQRVPVKILMVNPPTDVSLGPGMSVNPTVRIDPSPSIIERLWKRR